jgi:hypothetical protein
MCRGPRFKLKYCKKTTTKKGKLEAVPYFLSILFFNFIQPVSRLEATGLPICSLEILKTESLD